MGFIPNSEEWYFNKKSALTESWRCPCFQCFIFTITHTEDQCSCFCGIELPSVAHGIERGGNNLKKHLSGATWSCFFFFFSSPLTKICIPWDWNKGEENDPVKITDAYRPLSLLGRCKHRVSTSSKCADINWTKKNFLCLWVCLCLLHSTGVLHQSCALHHINNNEAGIILLIVIWLKTGSEPLSSESSLTSASSPKARVSFVMYSIPGMSNISVQDERRYECNSSWISLLTWIIP